jgi:hypothetical protein
MATEEQVVYYLKALCRHDKEVDAYVGVIPRLNLFSQARTEENLKIALEKTATRYILACAERGMLFSVLREAGGVPEKLSVEEIEKRKEHHQKHGVEFVAFLDEGYEECSETIEVKVPIEVLASQQVSA